VRPRRIVATSHLKTAWGNIIGLFRRRTTAQNPKTNAVVEMEEPNEGNLEISQTTLTFNGLGLPSSLHFPQSQTFLGGVTRGGTSESYKKRENISPALKSTKGSGEERLFKYSIHVVDIRETGGRGELRFQLRAPLAEWDQLRYTEERTQRDLYSLQRMFQCK